MPAAFGLRNADRRRSMTRGARDGVGWPVFPPSGCSDAMSRRIDVGHGEARWPGLSAMGDVSGGQGW